MTNWFVQNKGEFRFRPISAFVDIWGLDQSECTMTSRQWRKLWEAARKTSPPISLELTTVIQLLTDFIGLHQSLVNFGTFCHCNFRSIVFFKRNRFLNNTKIRGFDENTIPLGPFSNLRSFAFSSKKSRRFP